MLTHFYGYIFMKSNETYNIVKLFEFSNKINNIRRNDTNDIKDKSNIAISIIAAIYSIDSDILTILFSFFSNDEVYTNCKYQNFEKNTPTCLQSLIFYRH